MASKALRQFIAGATNPKGNVGDFQHASRLFVDSDLRLAPKVKFLYHVSFSINPIAMKSRNLKYQHQNEINMLVKAAELPRFSIQTDTLNQYNRKRITQVKIDYQPITIRFHDDNLGVVGQLWQSYYSYYFGDPTAASIAGSYGQTAMQPASLIRARYGLDNDSSVPFFNSIVIHQLAKRAYYSYELINPRITSWSHDSLDSSSSQPSEQSMQLSYEAVRYDTGNISRGVPPGFAEDHYDQTPSPISLAGGGTTTLFGAGGVLAGASTVFGALGSGKAFESPANFIATAITAVNTYQNAKKLNSSSIKGELTNIAVKGLQNVGNQGLSGLSNISMPVSNPNTSTPATQRNITGGGP